jgi:hypothetical protein
MILTDLEADLIRLQLLLRHRNVLAQGCTDRSLLQTNSQYYAATTDVVVCGYWICGRLRYLYLLDRYTVVCARCCE